jgi:Zn finger protein HypA/HybF involved in hydrogenase expression
MKCYCKSKGGDVSAKNATTMVTDGKREIIKGNLFIRYRCPKCESERIKLIREDQDV